MYDHDGKQVVFMVAKTRSGDIKTAFDACITCYPHRQGYRADPGCVVCRYCGTSFQIDDLDKGIGNCIPIAVPHDISGQNVIIRQSDIEAGSRWF